MSTRETYLSILGNLSRFAPTDVDALINAGDRAKPAPPVRRSSSMPPSSVLWSHNHDDDVSHIGIRIKGPIKDASRLIGKLAALAAEKSVVPILISWDGNCGLQHFGLHVEQVSGATEDACAEYEQQLERMWNLAIIIDVDDVMLALG